MGTFGRFLNASLRVIGAHLRIGYCCTKSSQIGQTYYSGYLCLFHFYLLSFKSFSSLSANFHCGAKTLANHAHFIQKVWTKWSQSCLIYVSKLFQSFPNLSPRCLLVFPSGAKVLSMFMLFAIGSFQMLPNGLLDV